MNVNDLSRRFCLRYSFILDDMQVLHPSEIKDINEIRKYYVLAPGGYRKQLTIETWIARIKDWQGQQEIHSLYYSRLPTNTFREIWNGNIIDYWDLSTHKLGHRKISITAQGKALDPYQNYPCKSEINERKILPFFTKPEHCIEARGDLKAVAKSVTQGIGLDEDRAKRIFRWIVQNIKYDPGQQALSAKVSLEEMKGNCGGISLLFVALCRSVGIPSRIVSGAWLIPNHEGPHMWSEFYSCRFGWIPVDCSRAILLATSMNYRRKSLSMKLPSKPSFYFGKIDNRRVIFSKGSNIRLIPMRNFPGVYPYMRNHSTLFMQPSSIYPYISGPSNGYYVYRISHKLKAVKQ